MEKRPCLCNGSSDLHKIWHGDAYWPFEMYWQLKIPTFKNPILGTAAILKIAKRPYLRNCLTDLHEIWYGDANRHCKAYWQLKFQTCENPLLSPLFPSLPVCMHACMHACIHTYIHTYNLMCVSVCSCSLCMATFFSGSAQNVACGINIPYRC